MVELGNKREEKTGERKETFLWNSKFDLFFSLILKCEFKIKQALDYYAKKWLVQFKL